MKLLLLPAFDGTGAMFEPLIAQLGGGFEAVPIAYPETGPQDYDSLARYVQDRIGPAEYVVLGESFAGPLAYRMAARSRCRGAAFVATYLLNPSPAFLKVLGALPARVASWFVSRPWVIGTIALSRRADRDLARRIAANFGSVDPTAIKERLRTIGSLGGLPDRELSVPCLYLQATDDRLVPAARLEDYRARCSDLEVERVEGGHFVAQENPREVARLLRAKFGAS